MQDRTLQKWLTAFAAESYKAIVKALNEDGVIGEKQLKVHFDIIRTVWPPTQNRGRKFR